MNLRPVRPPRGLLILLALLVLAARGGPAKASEEAPPVPQPVGPLILEDQLEPLVPKQPRTEAEEDRLDALALFAAGRMFQGQRKFPEALRHYQRALRRDPEALDLARTIVPLAFALRRYHQAARYALKLKPDELADANPEVLRILGIRLTEQRDWAGAVKLYEREVAARAGEKQTGDDILLQMEMGRLYYLIDQYHKAADSFARVIYALDHPKEFELEKKQKEILLDKPGPTCNLIGECFLRADRTDEAVAAFERAHRVDPNKALLQFKLAQVHAHRGKPAEAIAGLQACFKQRLAGEGIVPYELLAEVLEDLGRKDELIQRLEKLHGDDPKNVPLGYFLAEHYRKAEQFKKAESLYLALIKKTPWLTGYRSLVEIYRKTKRPEELLAILGEAVATTGMLEALGAEGKAVSGDAELVRTLIETARKQYQDEPKKLDYGTRFAVALLALESKQFETANELFDLALKAKPKQPAELLLAWGVGLLVEKQAAKAAEVFQRAIDQKVLPEDNPAFYSYLARALAVDEKTGQALAAARKAVELKENAPRLHATAAWVLYYAKRNDQATKAYTELIGKFDSDHRSVQTREVLREARLTLSHLCVLRDDLAGAEQWLEQVLDEFPDDVGALNDLGYLWADQAKHLNRSLEMIRRAVEAEPDNVAYRDSLGWVLYRIGRYREALAELEKAAAAARKEGDQPDGEILDHLGEAYLKLNQPQKAKDAWRAAAKAFSKQEEPEKAKEVERKIKANESQITNDK